MCGFTIFVTRKNNFKNIKFNREILDHRGPDFFGSIKYKNIIFNHWRLSIVDHSKNSNQPLENNNYIFAYNGEIYDYLELSKKNNLSKFNKSDTKFLFNLLCKKNNLNSIKNYSGFYSYAYLNKNKNHITFSRDFLGKKPLFYYKDKDIFLISSEEKGIYNYIKKEIDKKSILEYFFYKNIFFDKTFFKNIKTVAPGAKLQFNINKWILYKSKSWTKYYNEKLFKNKNIKKFNNLFRKTLIKSIEKRNLCDVKTQLALSSGYDSSLILNLLKKNKEIKNFRRSISVGFNNQNNETIFAKKIANSLNSNIKLINLRKPKLGDLEKIIKYYDAPLEHPSSIGLDYICKETKKIDKVLITGEGADDLLFGYNHYNRGNQNSFAFRPFIKKKSLKLIFSNKKNLNFLKNFYKKIDIHTLRKKALSSIFFSRELEIKTHMQTLLKRNDRISMKNSVEIRCPFLDINLINLIPNKIKIRKQKYFSKLLDKKISKILDHRKKIGFYVPLSNVYKSNRVKVNNYIKNSIEFLELNGLFIQKKLIQNSEIKWVLLNIGIFLEQHEKR